MSVRTGQNNATMLDDLQRLNSELAATGTNKPLEWDTWNREQKMQYLQQVQKGVAQTRDLTDTLDRVTQNDQKAIQELANQGVQPLDQPQSAKMAKIVYNRRRMGQVAPQVPPATPVPAMPQPAMPDAGEQNLSTVDGLKQALSSFEGEERPDQSATAMLEQFVNDNQMITDAQNRPSDPRQLIRDAVASFYGTNDDAVKTRAATVIYEKILPDSVKGEAAPADGEVPGQLEKNVKSNLASIVERSNEAVRKLAESMAAGAKSAAKPTFNLRRYAQHKTLEQVIEFGADEKTIDQFTGDIISDWHLVERNKGFGLRLPGVLNIDWEKAWRENVMDKYTGTYIEDRFEVDHNVPALSNMQLAPGQLRKPMLPEYGNTEARLESERTRLNKERGYEPAEKGKVFNWKKAKAEAKKKVTVALDGGLKPLPALGDSGEKKLNTNPTWICPSCGNQMDKDAGGGAQCDKCHAFVKPLKGPPQQAPDAPGAQPGQQMAIQPNQMLTPGQQRVLARPVAAASDPSALKDAIFFDGDEQMFVVYAGTNQKMKFSSFDEAEKYAQSIPPRPLPPKVRQRVVAPDPALPPNANAAPQPVVQQPPAAGRNTRNRKQMLDADRDEAVGTDPRHHRSAHGLAIDG
jgi:hypothetical protein